jgi:hypothetical protein
MGACEHRNPRAVLATAPCDGERDDACEDERPMSDIPRLIPSKGASMRRDANGPYVRYLDHVETLARIEAVGVHQRAAMSTIPLDTAAEKLKAENHRLRAEVAALRAQCRTLAGAAASADRPRGAGDSCRGSVVTGASPSAAPQAPRQPSKQQAG